MPEPVGHGDAVFFVGEVVAVAALVAGLPTAVGVLPSGDGAAPPGTAHFPLAELDLADAELLRALDVSAELFFILVSGISSPCGGSSRPLWGAAGKSENGAP